MISVLMAGKDSFGTVYFYALVFKGGLHREQVYRTKNHVCANYAEDEAADYIAIAERQA